LKLGLAALVLVFIVFLSPARPVSATGPYWFQVGAFMQSATRVDVTGASVQIRTRVPSYNPNAYTSYWVGLVLSNGAFVQVGYVSWPANAGYPQRFWEYFPPNGADIGDGFHGDSNGAPVGPNGTWYTYSIEGKGNTWYAYINGILDGSYDLGASNSGGNAPYAVAEVEQAYDTNIPLGPVEFRELEYRDMNNLWYNVSAAVAWMGYGLGSGTPPTGMNFPYGLEVIGNNDWIAGTGLPPTYNNTSIWTNSAAAPEFSVTSAHALIVSLYPTATLLRKFPKGRRDARS